MKPGDVVVGVLVGAQETKVRPAVVIASATYLAERPDAVVGILTTKLPRTQGTTDYVLQDWQYAGLRAESCFRAYVLTAHRSTPQCAPQIEDAPRDTCLSVSPAVERGVVAASSQISDRILCLTAACTFSGAGSKAAVPQRRMAWRSLTL